MPSLGITLERLFVSQFGLRHLEQMGPMIDFVRKGGIFDDNSLGSYAIRYGLPRVSPPIEIAKFEDGSYYIHNGHHRLVAIALGRDYPGLYNTEYFIRNWKYSDYTDIVLPGWVTPFDIENEIRVAELSDWKKEVHNFYTEHGEAKTITHIRNSRERYAVPRGSMYTLDDFIGRFQLYALKHQ